MPPPLIAILLATAVLAATLTLVLLPKRNSTRSVAISFLLGAETFVALFLLLGMVLSTLLQVIVRHDFSARLDFSWTEELARLLLVWGTYWSAATVHRNNDHLSVTVVYDLLPASIQRAVRYLVDVMVVVILGIITKEGFATACLQMGQSTITLDLPIAAFAVAVPIGCALMLIYTFANTFRTFTSQSALRA